MELAAQSFELPMLYMCWIVYYDWIKTNGYVHDNASMQMKVIA